MGSYFCAGPPKEVMVKMRNTLLAWALPAVVLLGCSGESEEQSEQSNLAAASISGDTLEAQRPAADTPAHEERAIPDEEAGRGDDSNDTGGGQEAQSEQRDERADPREAVSEARSARRDVTEEQSTDRIVGEDREPVGASRAGPTAVEPPTGDARSLEPELIATSGLHLSRMVIARGIEEREPLDSGTRFEVTNDGRIYAYIEVANPDAVEDEVEVKWVQAESPDEVISRVNVNVGPHPRWRTWAYTSLIREPGQYLAVVTDSEGRLIARAPFEVVRD